MAGLGLFPHKSALALAPRGLLQSAYGRSCSYDRGIFVIYHRAQYGWVGLISPQNSPRPGTKGFASILIYRK
jgi:hypothetical protein